MYDRYNKEKEGRIPTAFANCIYIFFFWYHVNTLDFYNDDDLKELFSFSLAAHY